LARARNLLFQVKIFVPNIWNNDAVFVRPKPHVNVTPRLRLFVVRLCATHAVTIRRRMIEPVIEVYFDPNGRWGGKAGCFCSRLRDFHGLHDAADTPEYAVKRLVQNIVCHQNYKHTDGTFPVAHLPHTPETLEGYQVVRVDPMYFRPVPGDWKARNEAEEADQVEERRQVNSMVAYMMQPRRSW
jgi:hypothetical protein